MEKNKKAGKSVLFLGFGIDRERKEAVSINTLRIHNTLQSLGYKSYIVSVGYKNNNHKDYDFGNTMLESVIKRKKVVSELKRFIEEKKITHVHDVFVLPLASIIFTLSLKDNNDKVVFIKELHNDSGYSRKFHLETIIRFVMNRKGQLNRVLNEYDKVFTRNRLLAKKFKLDYIPTVVDIHTKRKMRTFNVLNLCYLGHPLKKKGFYQFFKLFTTLPDKLKSKVKFNFALSTLGKYEHECRKLKNLAKENGINMSLVGRVKPSKFFRSNDVYILPIDDEYGAISTPNTILEAMEANCLVMTKRIKTLEGIVDESNSILLYSNDYREIIDKIFYILNNRETIEKFGKRAREYIITNHSEIEVGKKMENLYLT